MSILRTAKAAVPLRLKQPVKQFLVDRGLMRGRRSVPTRFEDMLPRVFTIETVSGCNLACPCCPCGLERLGEEVRLMTLENFKLVFDKIRRYAEEILLLLYGEPLLNKDTPAMLRYAVERGFGNFSISTNGTPVTRPNAEALISSGFTGQIIVSVDGTTQETYERYRIGGDVEKAKNAIRYLVEANRRHGNKVRISPQFLVFRHNEHQMDEFTAFCAELGLEPSFKPPFIQPGSGLDPSTKADYVRRPPHYANEAARLEAMAGCSDPRRVMTIQRNGQVILCCQDTLGKTNFGNIFKQDVLEIWNSPKYREYRRAIIDGHAPSFCLEKCSLY